MKRLLPPVLLLSAMVLFCAASVRHLQDVCYDTASLLAQAEAHYQAGNMEPALDLVTEAQDLWSSQEGFLGLALRHTEADDITIAFPALRSLCQEGSDSFMQECLRLRSTLGVLSRMEFPYLFNIL